MRGLGLKTGLVLQCGHTGTYTAPVYDGSILPHSVCSSTFAGKDITLSLMESLRTRGYSFDTLQDKECARLLKEEYCQIKLIEHKMKMVNNNQLQDTQYTSSDQKIYKLGQEKYTSVEGLFGTKDSQVHHYDIRKRL